MGWNGDETSASQKARGRNKTVRAGERDIW